MTLTNLNLSRMRNAEHFEFYTEVRDIIAKATPAALGITKYFDSFSQLLQKEDECLIIIRKSEFTDLLAELDKQRDEYFTGIANVIKAYTLHYNPEITEAANRLSIVFNTYGNLAYLPVTEETSKLYNLIVDLEGKYDTDVETLNIADWVRELKKKNVKYDELVKSRYEEKTEQNEKTNVNMKEIRSQLDEVYRKITQTIEVLSELSDTAEKTNLYKNFVTNLNVIIHDYKTRLAQREGRNEANRKKQEENEVDEQIW